MILTLAPPVPGRVPALPGFDDVRRVHRLNELYRDSAPTADGRVSIVDLSAIVCPGGRCPDHVGGIELRPDGSHFGIEGARYVGNRVATAVLGCWSDPTTCGNQA